MAGVRVKENEPIEVAIRRFKKQCEKAGILSELRKREHFEKPSVRKKKKALAAKKRYLRRMMRAGRLRRAYAASRSHAAGMNGIDVALVVLLLILALRGSWRGIFRESFGFAALVVGLLAAVRYADAGAGWLSSYAWASELSGPALVGVAFVAIFLVVSALDQSDRPRCATSSSGAARCGFPAVSVACSSRSPRAPRCSRFVLLFLQLFPVVPGIDRQIAGSRIARPMIAAAGAALRAGWRDGAAENRPA